MTDTDFKPGDWVYVEHGGTSNRGMGTFTTVKSLTLTQVVLKTGKRFRKDQFAGGGALMSGGGVRGDYGTFLYPADHPRYAEAEASRRYRARRKAAESDPLLLDWVEQGTPAALERAISALQTAQRRYGEPVAAVEVNE